MNKIFEAVNELDGDVIGDVVRAVAMTEGIVINRDLSVGMALRLTPPDTSCLGPDAKTGLYSQLRAVMNSLPDHFDVEWRSAPSFDVKPIERIYASFAGNRPGGLLGDVLGEVEHETINQLRRKELRLFTTYLIVVRRMPLTLEQRRRRTMASLRKLRGLEDAGGKPSLAKKAARLVEGLRIQVLEPNLLIRFEEDEFTEAVNDVRRQVRSIQQGLADTGFEPEICDNAGALDIFYQYWNRNRHDSGLRAQGYVERDERPIADYVVLSHFVWDPAGKIIPRGVFELDGLYHRLVSVVTPPNVIGRPVWPHFEDMLLYGGPRNMEMIVKCVQGDRNARLSLLRTEIRRAANAVETRKKKNSAAADADVGYLNQLRAEYGEIEQSLEKTWKAGVFFHLWDRDVEKLADSLNTMRKLANQLDLEVCEEAVSLPVYWRATQPFWTQDTDRNRLFDYTSRQVVGMLPICGQKTYLLPGRPLGAVFPTAARSLYNLFVHDPRRTANAHVCVCAGSRAGKSTLLNRFLVELGRYSLRAVIIDLGGSFRRFCATMNGNYIEFDVRDRSKCLNPLFIQGGRPPDEEDLRSRVLVLEQMLCDQRKHERFGPEETARVSEALRLTYSSRPGKEVTLSNLQEQLKTLNLAKWYTRLHEWVDTGGKAALFDGRNTMNMGNQLTVLDFQRVKDDQQLSAVLFHVAMLLAGQLAANYPKDLKLLICDEASGHLRNPVTAEAIDQSIRTLAKHGVGVVVLSQNFSDFTDQPLTRETFISNVPTWIFLRQDSAAVVEQIAKEKQLSPTEKMMLGNLKTVFGEYSEFLVVQTVNGRSETAHCFSVATPLMYAMMTTAASDRAVYQRYAEEGLALPDAVRRFAKEHPKGADIKFTGKDSP